MNLDKALQTFIIESHDLLQDMESSLLRLESAPNDPDILGAIFRAAHTIKGSAGMFGLDLIVNFTHVVESVLDKLRDGKIVVNGEVVELLLKSGDYIGNLVTVVAVNGEIPTAEMIAVESELSLRLSSLFNHDNNSLSSASEQDGVRSAELDDSAQMDVWHLSLLFGSSVLRDGMDPLSFVRYLGTLGEIVNITMSADTMPKSEYMDPEACYLEFEIDFRSEADEETIAGVFDFVREGSVINIVPPRKKINEDISIINHAYESDQRFDDVQVMDGGLEKRHQTKDRKVQENRYIRVHADKLDSLINLVGELVIAGASTNLLAARSGNPLLLESTSVVSSLVEDIRDSALQLRMVPIGETFNRFQRVVHDVSQELGKDIELVISGAETELDKTVIDKIGDPLMHLVRNAMDHGIESAELRIASGKPAKGMLYLNAYHDAGNIVIEVADDGSGLNCERLLKKAIERGLVTVNANLSDHEIYNLIFEPGFSTAEKLSNLSGRGVGMDVVRRNIEALRGTVELDSEPGVGTTVRIRLPLTLAIIDGFLVGVNHATYVIPLDMVTECVELDVRERQAGRQRGYLNLRGVVLPLVWLREQFDMMGEEARRENVVVVHYGVHQAGLVVDDLMGEFQTVIKPLGHLFGNVKGISGSTILGSGEVVLILDVPSLIQHAVERENITVVTEQNRFLTTT